MCAAKNPSGSGDAPAKKDEKIIKELKDSVIGATKDKKKKNVEQEEVQQEFLKTDSAIAREEIAIRAEQRRRRFIKRWPSVTKVEIKTKPWKPPEQDKRIRVVIEYPELKTRRWVPPYRRRRKKRPRRLRIPKEEITKPLYEGSKLKRIWHNFRLVDSNKMMLQGTIACNSKSYSAAQCGAQTGPIAYVARALLFDKSPAEFEEKDVDDVILAADKFYKQCLIAMRCYKGRPALQLVQLLPFFFFRDSKYTVRLGQVERGVLASNPNNVVQEPDLNSMMQRKAGKTFYYILTVGEDRHFLIWGAPPPRDTPTTVKTICYMFDPHFLNDIGQPEEPYYACCSERPALRAGAFIRYAGVQSFVNDFLANYGALHAKLCGKPRPPITLTEIEIMQKEPLLRAPDYSVDLQAMSIHCRSQWLSMHQNALIDKKLYQGEHALGSLSMVSLSTARSKSKKNVRDFYQRKPKVSKPSMPVAPDKGPPPTTEEDLMALRGEDFFLYCPANDIHMYGRDDMIPRQKSETVLHSPVDVADTNFISQYVLINDKMTILRATRHFASHRYQDYKYNTGLACCVAALGQLRRHRARAWNEDVVDEAMDTGANLYRESILDRGGPIRRLVLGELKATFTIRDREYRHRVRGIAVWGKIVSTHPKIFDLCRGIDTFFKESDSGVLQIPGEYETAIWYEGGKFYIFHPWPADLHGTKVGLRDGGKACVLCFKQTVDMCDHFLENAGELKRKAFSISDVEVFELKDLPESVANFKPVAPNKWVMRGTIHEGDSQFAPERRNKQGTPIAIMALAMSHVREPEDWTPEDIDDTLIRGDMLYQQSLVSSEEVGGGEGRAEGRAEGGHENEEDDSEAVHGLLAATDVLNRFKVSDFDCIQTEVAETAFCGSLHPDKDSGLLSLDGALEQMFKEHTHAVMTARYSSTAIWKHEGCYYYFDSHACDEFGYPSEDPRAAACVVRVKGSVKDLAGVIEANLGPGSDNSFNISPMEIVATKLDLLSGAPETKLESKAFEWIRPGAAAILMGPRGENTAIGKAANRAAIGEEDMAGRTLALPAAAMFVAAAGAVPPTQMHQDHMYNFLESGAEYYLKHVKRTGCTDMTTRDLNTSFELGANTCVIELKQPIEKPLKIPEAGEGGGEEGEGGKEGGEAEEEPDKEQPINEIKDVMVKFMNKPNSLALLVGDFHVLGVWCDAGGKVVAFDPSPTLPKGVLTSHRITRGDELAKIRAREMLGEGAEAEEEEDEEEGEGGPPEPVPLESSMALMVYSSPYEFTTRLSQQGGLDNKRCRNPYKLYPVTVTNELTSLFKDKSDAAPAEEEGLGGPGEECEEVTPLDDASLGKYFIKMSKSIAAVRGRVAQHEGFFMENPNRDNQDVGNAIMAVVIDHIEPYDYWKPTLLDAILKYGDRLYTTSLPRASDPPLVKPEEVVTEFDVTQFTVRLEVEPGVVTGDLKAGDGGSVMNLKKGINTFLENYKYGVLCAKRYCVAFWRATDEKSMLLWEPHAVGPVGRFTPSGACALLMFSTITELVDIYKSNIEKIARPGSNKYSIASVKVEWKIRLVPPLPPPEGQVADEPYECKVLTGYVEIARGRTILRGSKAHDIIRLTHEWQLRSAPSAIVATCLSFVRKPYLWTKKVIDEIMCLGSVLFEKTLPTLGYEFRPSDDVLSPLQVLTRFVLGVNYVRYDLEAIFTGRLEQLDPSVMSVRCALERFFQSYTHGVLWSPPHAVGVWCVTVQGSPLYYMFEPHACGLTGLRTDVGNDGAPCCLTFTSAKLLAYAYLQSIPLLERPRHEFTLYRMSVVVKPIEALAKCDPPLVSYPHGSQLVPATSKVYMDGTKRRALEEDRKRPPGEVTCGDTLRATQQVDENDPKYKGQRTQSGWLVLADGTQYVSAQHSIYCKKFSTFSRGYQAITCCMVAVATSRVEEVCRWNCAILDQILENGDRLYQDSFLHYKPKGTNLLNMEQILRKFYTPGGYVCRVTVYRPRHDGEVCRDLHQKLLEFFAEERSGVLIANGGEEAAALFRTPKGYYMFDPADRDRYGRAVSPACRGIARACLSQYPCVKLLAEKLAQNIPPIPVQPEPEGEGEGEDAPAPEGEVNEASEKEIRLEEPATFEIYGMEVSSLRKLMDNEK